MIKHLEVKTVEHKGIKVMVKLDYEAGTASLVEMLNANNQSQFPNKKWCFGNRTLDYMNGWLDILEAMTLAVKECKKDLEHDLAEKSRFRDNILIKVHEEENKNKKNKKART